MLEFLVEYNVLGLEVAVGHESVQVSNALEYFGDEVGRIQGRQAAAAVEHLQTHLVVEGTELASLQGRECEVPAVVHVAAEVAPEARHRLPGPCIALARGLDGPVSSDLCHGLFFVHRMPLPAKHSVCSTAEAGNLQLALVPVELPLLLQLDQHSLLEALYRRRQHITKEQGRGRAIRKP